MRKKIMLLALSAIMFTGCIQIPMQAGGMGYPGSNQNNSSARSLTPNSAYSIWQNNSAMFMNVSQYENVKYYGQIMYSSIYEYQSAQQFDTLTGNLNKNATYVVYDSQNGVLGRTAASRLASRGFTKVYYINGGLNAWRASGYPIMDGQRNTPVRTNRRSSGPVGAVVQ